MTSRCYFAMRFITRTVVRRRHLFVLALMIVCVLLTTDSRAQNYQPTATTLINFSPWRIKDGILQEQWTFQANGVYEYQTSNGYRVESGRYAVQGYSATLMPSKGPQKTIRWNIESRSEPYFRHPYNTTPILWVQFPDGRQQSYFPNWQSLPVWQDNQPPSWQSLPNWQSQQPQSSNRSPTVQAPPTQQLTPQQEQAVRALIATLQKMQRDTEAAMQRQR
jgi:hypothetical protein